MSEQNIINLYINELATTKHEFFVEKDKVAELEGQLSQITSAKAGVDGENAQLRSELQILQGQYNTLKEQVGSVANGGTPASATPAPVSDPSHF